MIISEAKHACVKDAMIGRTARTGHNADIQHAAGIVALAGVSDLMVIAEIDKIRGVPAAEDILRTVWSGIDGILDEDCRYIVEYSEK